MLARLCYCLLVAALVAGCNAPPESQGNNKPMSDRPRGNKPFVGVYVQQASDPGTGYRLEVHPDGKWAMANLSSGFWGRWTDDKGKVTLTIIEGSSGKLTKQVTILPLFDGNDEVRLGEEWGPGQFIRQTGASYMISFVDTSLAR